MSVIRTFHLSELSQSHRVRISDFPLLHLLKCYMLYIIAPYIYDARHHAHPYILSTTILSDIP